MARPDNNGEIQCQGCERKLPGTVKYFHRHRDAFKPRCKECCGSSFGVHHYNKVVDTPEGKKVCAGCREVLPADPEHFHHTQKTSDGYTSRCKECRGEGVEYGVHKPNRVRDIPEGMWHCSSCETVLPLNSRYFYERGDGFERYCKPCSNQRKNQARRNADDELSGKEWMLIKAKWLDGGIVRCAYCGSKTERPERDHVQPLSQDGATAPQNIVPACPECNRRKNDKNVTEWYPDSDVFDADRWHRIQEHLRSDKPIPS